MQKHLSVLFIVSLISTNPTALRSIKPQLENSTISNSNKDVVKDDLVVASPAKNAVFAYVDTNARTFGAYGDGWHDDTKALQAYANWCFGNAVNFNGNRHPNLNKPFVLFNGVFLTSSPIMLYHVHGGIIKGAGRFATTIENSKTNIFQTNGFEFTTVSDLQLISGNRSNILFDMDWDGSPGSALQSNSFSNIYFQGGSRGLAIARSGQMGSENLIQNCFFESNTVGISTNGFNALQNLVIGGDIQGDSIGVYIGAGNINVNTVSFQAQSYFDIVQSNSAYDILSVIGCRTESKNFVCPYNVVNCTIQSCSQTSSEPGYFAKFITGQIIGCNSIAGMVTPNPYVGAKKIMVEGSYFGRKDWLQDTAKANVYIAMTQWGAGNNGDQSNVDTNSIKKVIIKGKLIQR